MLSVFILLQLKGLDNKIKFLPHSSSLDGIQASKCGLEIGVDDPVTVSCLSSHRAYLETLAFFSDAGPFDKTNRLLCPLDDVLLVLRKPVN